MRGLSKGLLILNLVTLCSFSVVVNAVEIDSDSVETIDYKVVEKFEEAEVKELSEDDFTVWLYKSDVSLGDFVNDVLLDLEFTEIPISNNKYSVYNYLALKFEDFELHVTNEGFDIFKGNDYKFVIQEICLTSPKYITNRGIRIGSSYDSVIRAYGMGATGSTSSGESVLFYHYEDKLLRFNFGSDNLVSYIVLSNNFLIPTIPTPSEAIYTDVEDLVYVAGYGYIFDDVALEDEEDYDYEFYQDDSYTYISSKTLADITTNIGHVVGSKYRFGNKLTGRVAVDRSLLEGYSLDFDRDLLNDSTYIDYNNSISCYKGKEKFINISIRIFDMNKERFNELCTPAVLDSVYQINEVVEDLDEEIEEEYYIEEEYEFDYEEEDDRPDGSWYYDEETDSWYYEKYYYGDIDESNEDYVNKSGDEESNKDSNDNEEAIEESNIVVNTGVLPVSNFDGGCYIEYIDNSGSGMYSSLTIYLRINEEQVVQILIDAQDGSVFHDGVLRDALIESYVAPN